MRRQWALYTSSPRRIVWVTAAAHNASMNPATTVLSERRVHTAFWTACMACAVSGCASVAPETPPAQAEAVPAAWSTSLPAQAHAGTSLARWWELFHDPLLTNLIERSERANTSIRSAQAALRQARALREVNAAGLLPGVGATASAQRNQTDSASPVNSFRLGLDASWEPDIFGGQHSALQAMDADVLASGATLADVKVSVAAEVALAYLQLRAQQARQAIASSNLASQQQTLKITQWRTQAGLASALEVQQARSATEQTSAQLPALQAAILNASHSLAVLTGQTPQALQALSAQAGAIPQASDDVTLAIPAQTLRQRPDVRAAEHRIQAALARVSAADAARYPGFSVSASVGANALTLGALTSGATVVNALLASIALPVFDGGAAQAQVRAQQASLEQVQVAYEATVLNALKEVEDALASLTQDRLRWAHLKEAAAAASDAAQMAQQRYASGLIDFQIVLQAQRTLLAAQDSLSSASADLGTDVVRLYKALGGGWQ